MNDWHGQKPSVELTVGDWPWDRYGTSAYTHPGGGMTDGFDPQSSPDDWAKGRQKIEVHDPMAAAIQYLAANIGHLAGVINRLAATQEKPPQKSSAVSFTQANYEDTPDEQTASLREIASKRERDSGAS